MAAINLMENIDKISNAGFFQSGNFSVSIVSKFGRKGNDGNRYGSFRESNYQLKTVNGQPFVKSFDISNTSDYLVFAFKGKIGNEFKSEEIYVSYPQLDICTNYFKENLVEISNNIDKYYSNNTLTEVGLSYQVDSPEMVGQKYFTMVLDIFQNDKVCIKGVSIYFTQEISVFLSLEGLLTLTEKLNRVNLEMYTMMTSIMGMQLEIYEMLKNLTGGNNLNETTNRSIGSRTNSSRLASRGGNRSINRTENTNSISNGNNKTPNQTVKIVTRGLKKETEEVKDLNEIDDSEPFVGVENKNSSTNSTINDILNLSEEIDIDSLLNEEE